MLRIRMRQWACAAFLISTLAAQVFSECNCQQRCKEVQCYGTVYPDITPGCLCFWFSQPSAVDYLDFTGTGNPCVGHAAFGPDENVDLYTGTNCQCYCHAFYGCTGPMESTCAAGDYLTFEQLQECHCGGG